MIEASARFEKLRRRQNGNVKDEEVVVVAAKKSDGETTSSNTRRHHRTSHTRTQTGTATATGTRSSRKSGTSVASSSSLLNVVASSAASPTSTVNAASKQQESSAIKGLSKTGEIAVIVGAALGALAVIAGFILIFLLCRWRRKDKSQQNKAGVVKASKSKGTAKTVADMSNVSTGVVAGRKNSLYSGTDASNNTFQAVQVDQRPYSQSIYDGTLDAYTGNYEDDKYSQHGGGSNGASGYGHGQGHAGSFSGTGYPYQPYQNADPAYTHSRNRLEDPLY